tara:strand:- start:13591 stop:15036 length:1446 start_codon:yes stop_codon:yes gene_type:complete
MKKLLLLFFLLPISLSAQEKYFHELKGMEDSTGTTHLFYRMYERIPYQCSEEQHGELIYNIYNDVYHINTAFSSDSIKFNDYYKPWCFYGKVDAEGIADFDFYEKDPKKWIVQNKLYGCYPYPVSDYLGRILEVPGACLTIQKPIFNEEPNNKRGFLLSNKEDSLYYNGTLEGFGFRVAIKEDFSPSLTYTNEEEYGFYNNYISSVKNVFGVSTIHPTIDSLFYTKNDSGHLLVSKKYSSGFGLADSTSAFYHLAFDTDSSILYSIVTVNQDENYERNLKKSTDFGFNDSWKTLSIPEHMKQLQWLDTDSEIEGSVFITDSISIFKSSDFGQSFELVREMDSRITGLYKKPNSYILYVLTRVELFEVNTLTNTATSLKKLSVSNDEEQKDFPNSVKLFQNYPNPFNPSTNINYAIPKATNVKFDVFDYLGRKVQTLVDEFQNSGEHSVRFNLDGFSSGIYYYRITVNEPFTVLTKQMTFIK